MKYYIAKPRLPMEYQEVEWIESHGTEYIDSRIAPSQIIPIAELDCYLLPTDNTLVGIFGAYGTSDTRFQIYKNSIGIGSYVNISPVPYTRYKFYLDGKNCIAKMNDTIFLSGFTNANGFTNETLLVFTRNEYNNINPGYPQRVYYCKIWNDTIIVRHYIPCFRKSDGVIGLYDLCGSICPLTSTPFYINSGTGTFTKGANKTELVKCDIATYDSQNNVIERCNIVHDLPRAYQRVEWIESHGTELINANLSCVVGDVVETDAVVQFTAYPAVGTFFLNGGDSGLYWGIYNRSGVNMFANTSSNNLSPIAYADNNKHHFVVSINTSSASNTIKIDDNTYTSTRDVSYYNSSLFVFGYNIAGLYKSKQKLWDYKIKINNVLVRNFIPCYRKSDNVIGLYDTINDKFYTNQGSGTFGKGADVN